MTDTPAGHSTQGSSKAWPAWGIASVALIMSRNFLITPELTPDERQFLPDRIVKTVSDRQLDLLLGNGLSWLGVACFVVFIAGLWRLLRAREPSGSLLPVVALGGGLVTAAGTMLGYGFLAQLAASAADGNAASTIAAVAAIGNGLAYGAWAWIGIVTAAVAVAGIRRRSVPKWLGVVSAAFTALFVATAFFPFVAWFPAVVWLLVASAGLLLSARSRLGESG